MVTSIPYYPFTSVMRRIGERVVMDLEGVT